MNTAEILNREHEVRLIVFDRLEREYKVNSEVPIDCLNVPARKNRLIKVINQVKRIHALKKIRGSFQPDIVYSLTNSANLANALSGIHSYGKSIVSVRGYREVKKSRIDRFMYQSADAVITVSDGLCNKLMSEYPALQKIITIYNGLDLEKIQEKSRESVTEEKNGFTFVCVGRLEEVKGQDRLLHAFSIVYRKHSNTNLLLIGDGSKRSVWKSLSRNLGLDEAVQFAGQKENPYAYLSEADVYVLPSRNEGFPGSLVEAMVCGLPVVSVDCESGPREILSDDNKKKQPASGIEEREYGILCECGDDKTAVKALADGMLRIYEQSDLREEYRNKAKKRAQDFSLEAYQKNMMDLFETVINEK